MFKKQKSLEVLVTSMRHKIKIKNICIHADFFYDLRLGLGVRISFKFHFAEGPEIHHVTQTNRTGHICPSVAVWLNGGTATLAN